MAENQSLDTILEEALKIVDLQARGAYLDEVCGDDQALRNEIDSLLAAHFAAEGFMEPSAEQVWLPQNEKEGDWIGRYRLLELIGEGGFGRVWMAEQREPMERKVALKIVKLGMDTGQVVARFEAERVALAMMDHPNIAHVFDGGATRNGRPYFVMELVRGVPITTYCDANKLSPRARIDLFRKVCEAVQHAHLKGIIHRDLKPSNILVTVQDDKPVPKVIDFGVAKALQKRLTERTLFTRMAQWIGTPEYMSPEQAGLGSHDVETRSDVYTLGVILYELLTGRTPFGGRELREEGYEAILRKIREEDPPRPSTRLSSLTREEMTAIADHRGESPEKLGHVIRGELDWILLKALERDRSRRYETANGLANDLGRYVAGDPISAAPPTLGYRVGKVIRKHWKAATIAASFVLLIIATAVTSTILAVQANRAADRATRAEGDARQQKDLALEQRDLTRTNYYVASIPLAWRDWQAGNVNRMADTLMDFLPRGDTPDLRGWVWYYLASLLEDDGNILQSNLGSIESVEFSPDGTLLAVAGESVSIYDWQTKRLIRSLSGQAPIAWRPKHRQLASVTESGGEGEITFWDIDSGDASRRINYPWIVSMAWRPDGLTLALGGNRRFGIWEEGMDGPHVYPKPRPENINNTGSLAWSPDGGLLAMAFGFPGQILVWSADDRSFLKTIDVSGGTKVLDLTWSAASGQLAHGTHTGYVHCWDVETQEKLLQIHSAHGGDLLALSWNPDGTLLATGGNDQLVKVWDPGDEGRLVTQFAGHRGPVKSMAWTPDGSAIVSGAADGCLRLWRLDRGQASMSLPGKALMAWSPDSRKVATAKRVPSPDKSGSFPLLLIYDAQTGAVERELGHSVAPGMYMEWSPDGNLLGIAGPDSDAQVWDTKSGRLVHRLTDIHVPSGDWYRESRCFTWSPDGRKFATCGMDRRIKIWEAESAKLLQTLEGHEAYMGTVRWSPDGRWFLSACWRRHVKIWDPVSWECLLDLQPTEVEDRAEGAYSAAWSPDSRRIATRTGAGGLVVWELTDDRPPRRVWSVRAHSANIRSVDWSPDGRRIASGSEDSLVKVWDAATGREMLAFDHSGWVQTVAWSPDGTRLAAADGPRGIIVIRDARKALGVDWEARLEAAEQARGQTQGVRGSAATRSAVEGSFPVVTD